MNKDTSAEIRRSVLIAIPCLLTGGTERQTLMLARTLIDLECKVAVYCYFEKDELVADEFCAAGADVHTLNWSRRISSRTFITSFSEVIRSTKPDIVHVQYMAPGLLCPGRRRSGRGSQSPIFYAGSGLDG
jgi:hypothetical protein